MSNGTVTLSGPQVGDTQTGGSGSDVLAGGAYGDTLTGGGGADVIYGGAPGLGGDKIYGGDGADLIATGPSSSGSQIYGGAGSDTFVFHKGYGAITISDFTAGVGGDIILIQGYSDAPTITQVGADTVLSYGGDTVTLTGVTKSSFLYWNYRFGDAPPTPDVSIISPEGAPQPSLSINGPYAVAAGQVLNLDHVGLNISAFNAAVVTNAGQVSVTGADSAWGAYFNGSNGGFQNLMGGVLQVLTLGYQAVGVHIGSGSATTSNAGQIYVAAAGGGAVGLEVSASDVTVANSGLIDVWGLTATGATFSNQTQFNNTGDLHVRGLEALGVSFRSGGGLNNTGNIVVYTGDLDSPGVAVEIAAWDEITLQNSGLIQGDYAIHVGASYYSPPPASIEHVENTGQIRGAVYLSDGDDTISNNGTIQGWVDLGTGDDRYTGTGMQYGLVLGQGGDDVLKPTGASGYNLYGGDGADTITGGAGNDVIDGGRDGDILDGGAGAWDMASYATANMAATVDLQAGTGVSSGTDSLANFESARGGAYDDHLYGSGVTNRLEGLDGDDVIDGRAGDDFIRGGAGDDLLTGGAGKDNFELGFAFSNGPGLGGHDVITDFSTADDTLYVYNYATWTVQQVGADTLITFSAADSVLLKNFQASSTIKIQLINGDTAWPFDTALLPPVGSQPIVSDTSYRIYAGEYFSFSGFETPFTLTSRAEATRAFVNEGSFAAANAGDDLTGFVLDYFAAGGAVLSFLNAAGASFSVATTGDGDAVGVQSGGSSRSFTNAGTFVVSSQGDATGFYGGDVNQTVANTGTMQITASGLAVGIEGYNGGHYDNQGELTVSGDAGAFGVRLLYWGQNRSFSNSGHITALSSGGVSVAVDASANDYGTQLFTNSGVLTGDYAFRITASSSPPSPSQDVLNNSGRLEGRVFLDMGNDVFNNSGVVTGLVELGAGDDIYAGADGVEKGGVSGGAGNDVLVGGAGRDVALYGVASTGASLLHNANGSWRVTAGADGIDVLTSFEVLRFTDRDVLLVQPTQSDFNADGKSDVLWRNDSGELYVWNSQGGQGAFLGQTLGNPGTGWAVQNVADYDGDGKADVLWRNAHGDLYVYRSDDGAAVSFSGQSISYVDPVWKVVPDSGDFDGDGRADILFRNSDTGEVYLWNSNTGADVSFLGQSLGAVGNDWSIQAVDDFNADGRADVLWRSTAGDVYVWKSTGNGPVGVDGQTISSVGNDWSIVGTGDFNGDGRADILWRHAGDGELYVWNSQTSSEAVNFVGQSVGAVSTDWAVAAVGDYDGDGRADVLFRNADGRVYVWNSNDNGAVGFVGQGLGSTPTDWHLLGDGDYILPGG